MFGMKEFLKSNITTDLSSAVTAGVMKILLVGRMRYNLAMRSMMLKSLDYLVPKGYNSTRSAHTPFGRDLASWTGAREVPTWSMVNFTAQYHAPQTASAKLVSFIDEQCLEA
jgi:hypothetical protein